MRLHFGRRRTWLALGVSVLVLAACTNSKFIIGTFYKRMDNKALDAIAEWTDLQPEQSAEVRAYIGTFHTWHRRTQLPAYANWIRSITATVATPGQATPEDFDTWFGGMREHMEALRACHPAHYAVPLGRTLTLEQVDLAEKTWRERRAKNRERFADVTREERIDRRVANTRKFLGRLGFDLTSSQRTLIKATMLVQPDIRAESRQLADDWNEAFFSILRDKDVPNFDEQLAQHVTDLFSRNERAYPDEWNERRLLWRDFAIRFEKTLSAKQRAHAVTWLNKLSRTLDQVALDRPEWLPADDPAYGCVVGVSGSNGAPAGIAEPQ